MTTQKDFFDITFETTVKNVRNIYTSDESMSALMSYERALDQAGIYSYANWEAGELVHGPMLKKYTTGCIFQYPYKLMPDPAGAKRLLKIGARIKFKKTKVKIPVKVKSENDYEPGKKYPKMKEVLVWLVYVELPNELIDDIKKGTQELMNQTVNLDDISDAYMADGSNPEE